MCDRHRADRLGQCYDCGEWVAPSEIQVGDKVAWMVGFPTQERVECEVLALAGSGHLWIPTPDGDRMTIAENQVIEVIPG